MTSALSTATAPAILGEMHERNKILEFALSAVEKSTAYNDTLRPMWDESIRNYMVAPLGDVEHYPKLGMRSPRGRSQGAIRLGRHHRANLKSPTTHEIIEDMAGSGIGLLMPNLDFIQASPIGTDDIEKGRYLSRMLESLLRMKGLYRTNLLTFKDGFIIGTGIIEIGWESRTRTQMTLVPVFDPDTNEFLGQRYEPREVLFANGPLVRQIDRYDFYPDPSGTRIQEDMEYCGKRFMLPKYEAIDRANSGQWNKVAVGNAIAHEDNPKNTRNHKSTSRFMELRREGPGIYNMLHGIQIWAHLPFRPADGVRNRVLTIINGELVENIMNPYQDGNFPVKEFVLNPIAGRFDGISPAETNRFLQDSEDSLLMNVTDTSNIAANNILLAGVGAGININRLRARHPGDVISCNDPTRITPVPFDSTALGLAMQELTRRGDQQRRAAGSINAQTIASVGRPTTGTTNQIVRLASQRVELMVQLVERDGYPWMGQMLHSRIRQFLGRGGQAILAGERFPIDLNQIDYESDVRFLGSRFAETPAQKNAKWTRALDVFGKNPQLVLTAPELSEMFMLEGLEIRQAQRIIRDMQQRLLELGDVQTDGSSDIRTPQTEEGQISRGEAALA